MGMFIINKSDIQKQHLELWESWEWLESLLLLSFSRLHEMIFKCMISNLTFYHRDESVKTKS